jgi:hypothetical protein
VLVLVEEFTVRVRVRCEMGNGNLKASDVQVGSQDGDRNRETYVEASPRGVQLDRGTHGRPRVSYADNHSGLPEGRLCASADAVLLVDSDDEARSGLGLGSSTSVMRAVRRCPCHCHLSFLHPI